METILNEFNSTSPSKELIYNDRVINNSSPLINAYENLMNATIETMQAHDPQHATCWTWGICEVSDICYEEAHFYYGSDDDKPKDFPLAQKVWVKVINSKISSNNHLSLIE